MKLANTTDPIDCMYHKKEITNLCNNLVGPDAFASFKWDIIFCAREYGYVNNTIEMCWILLFIITSSIQLAIHLSFTFSFAYFSVTSTWMIWYDSKVYAVLVWEMPRWLIVGSRPAVLHCIHLFIWNAPFRSIHMGSMWFWYARLQSRQNCYLIE